MTDFLAVLTQYGVVLALMVVNIIAGTSIAAIKDNFNKEQLMNGLYKAGTIVLIIAAILAAGYFNSGFEINGYTAYDMLMAVAYAGDALYGVQVVEKLINLIGLSTIPTAGE